MITSTQHLYAQLQAPDQTKGQSSIGALGVDREKSDAPRLTKLAVPGSQVSGIATAMSLRYRDMTDVRISPDVRNQKLIVMAPQSLHSVIASQVVEMLKKSDVRKSATATEGTLQIDLAHLSWRQFEQALRTADGGGTTVTTSRNGQTATYKLMSPNLQGTTVHVSRQTNTVRIEAPAASAQAWQNLIGYLDQDVNDDSHSVELVPMGDAEMAPIQRAIFLLKNLTPTTSNRTSQNNRHRGNSIFRTAAFQQDVGPGGNAGAADGNGAQAGEEGGSGVIGDAQIQFVPELGQIIIRGTPRDIARIKGVINDIQKASALTQPKIEVVKLMHADANAVSTLLAQLYEDVLSARQGEVSITSLDSPNSLLLIGREEAITALKDLIAKIDKPVDPESRLRVFRLQNASAADAEATINGFFVDKPSEGGGGDPRPGLGPRVRVLADYRTNSLIVSASPRDMTEVTRLINDLDVQNIDASNQIKVFQLNNAAAEDLAETLQDAISGEGDGGNDNVTPPSTSLTIVALDAAGQRVVSSGILSGATVTADTGANAIVVRAPAPSMPLIAELIRQLDRAPGIDSLVKVFTIENGDAQQLTTALTALFGDEAATSGTTIGAANLAGLPPTTASAESTLVPLRFSPDIRTNSIIVSGSAADLEVVESILLRLDSEGFAERITEVIWLRHSDAVVIATAVTEYVNTRQTGQQNISQLQQGLGPYDLPDRDLIVVPEVDSNSLLISVSPRLYEEVRRMIDQLDRRRPMVLIKIIMAEVTLDDTFEIGGEFGLQDSLVFDRGQSVADTGSISAGDPGFNFNNAGVPNINTTGRDKLAAAGMSTFGLGTTSPFTNYGGFVLNAASESISLLMRTLHEANRLQLLSRPQVMTLDNVEALVRVGRQVARVSGVENTNFGTQLDTEDIDVGLILRVRPRVGADGLITMNIDLTRSARDTSNGTVVPSAAGNVFIDDIIDTTAQSTLTAFSGQTVVFGGLIQKSRTNQSRRVPVMADIPLVGNLFKYDIELETRNELLVVLTPMVVNGDQDLDYIKQTESSRMSWCLADVVESHGDVGLSGGYGLWGPAVGSTIYPDIHPTVQNEVVVSDQPLHGGSQVINDPTGNYGSPAIAAPVNQAGQPMLESNTGDGNSPNFNNQPPVSIEQFRSQQSGELIETTPREILPTPTPQKSDGASINRSEVMQSSYDNAADFNAPAAQYPNQTAGWWNAGNNAGNGAGNGAAGRASTTQKTNKPVPVRLGSQLSSKKSVLPIPKWQSATTDAPASDPSSSTLLPAISPRSWIR